MTETSDLDGSVTVSPTGHDGRPDAAPATDLRPDGSTAPTEAVPREVPDPPVVPDPPAAAEAVFGERLDLARAYAGLLCGAGAVRGVIGPRETERIWDRHVLNCAVLAPLLPESATVTDVGSGGGLPGIVLALARPDLRLTLVDSMQRRTDFLTEVVAELGLGDRVAVVRGRAEELKRRDRVVTARAVADPVRLGKWAVRLLGPGGQLAVLVGAKTAEDQATWVPVLQKSGWSGVTVAEAGLDRVSPSWVLQARRR